MVALTKQLCSLAADARGCLMLTLLHAATPLLKALPLMWWEYVTVCGLHVIENIWPPTKESTPVFLFLVP